MRNVKRIPCLCEGRDRGPCATPQGIKPELCKLARIPAGDNWAHEIKFDGFRMHARALPPEFGFLAVNSAMLPCGPSNAWQWASSCES